MSFLAELKRRNVIRMAGLYLVGAWLMVQVAETVLPAFDVPAWVLRAIIVVLALAFVPALVFSWVFELTPDGLKRDAEVAPGQSIAPQTARRMDRLIVFGLLGVVALVAADRFWPLSEKSDKGSESFSGRERGSESVSGPADSAIAFVLAPESDSDPVSPVSSNSIAVLPFVNMSSDKEQEYFSDGLSEELLNQLGQIPQLRVIARTSSFSFKGKEVDVATIAKVLDVAHVLEGSVRKSGNRLRITAQLIRTADSSHLWSQTYDREMADVFDVQDEIAGEVVAALKVKLMPSQQLTNTQRTSNAEAYEQYLLGARLQDAPGPAAVRGRVDAFQRAIALDPNYANAYAGLAFSEGTQADFADNTAQREDMIRQALATADKAIALAPDLPDGYAARGNTRHRLRWDWPGAQADFERAIALDAINVTTLINYGPLLFSLGRREQALALLRKATAVDPLSASAWNVLGRHLAADHQVAAARAALQRSIELRPDHNWANFLLGTLELSDGRVDVAASHFARAPDQFRLTGMAMVEHTRGDTKASQQALDKLESDYAIGFAFQIAQVHAWRGDKDQALGWLDRSYAIHDAGMARLTYDPALDSLRDDPHFGALVKKMGFPERAP